MTSRSMKILLAYDGSPSADVALDDLTWAGLPRTAEIKVVSIADVWPHTTLKNGDDALNEKFEALPVAVRMARLQAAQAVDEAQRLAERVQGILCCRFPHWPVQAQAFADSPAWGIIKVADEWPADLIVLGTHGYSMVHRFVLGSVAQKVVTEAHCSVRLARPHGRFAGSPMRFLIGVDSSHGAQAAVRAVAARTWPRDTEF